MYEIKNEENIITVCFEDIEDLFKYSEVCYNKGLNIFPYFLHKERVIESQSIPHYHEGIQETRPHLHIPKFNGDELQISMELLDTLWTLDTHL